MSAEARPERTQPHADRFDFERLEQSIDELLRDHERLTAEREALMSELVDREHRIATLESRLRDERDRRATALDGVSRILARVESLQASVLAAERGDADGAGDGRG
jgi:chromosome segregation ATPase